MLPFRGNIEDYDEYLVFEILLTILINILLPIEQTIFIGPRSDHSLLMSLTD